MPKEATISAIDFSPSSKEDLSHILSCMHGLIAHTFSAVEKGFIKKILRNLNSISFFHSVTINLMFDGLFRAKMPIKLSVFKLLKTSLLIIGAIKKYFTL